MHPSVHSNTIHNNQDMEVMEVYIEEWIKKMYIEEWIKKMYIHRIEY